MFADDHVLILIRNGLVVTIDPSRRIIENGAIAIEGDRISDLGATPDLEAKHKGAETIDASGKIIIPGLVCSHSHLYGMLLRGASLPITPPSDFTQILQRVWWPVDEALTYEDAYASALVASMEFAKSGTTLFADTYSGPNSIEGVLDHIARGVEEIGIRGFIAFEATERHTKAEGEQGVKENIRYARKIAGKPEAKALPMLSIHASFTVTDDLIARVRNYANELHIPITIHTSEGMGDVHHNLENYGKRTVERLSDVGLLGPDVVLAHCVNLTDDELDLVKQTGAKIAHNPMSNMLNAVGVAPLVKMLARGIPVGLGNDGYIFDMFENMRAAFLLHRVHAKDPRVTDPYRILEMATIDGARLYGKELELGSLEIGKKADIVIVNPRIMPTPLTAKSVVGHLVNTVDGDDVQMVLVDGKRIVDNGKVVGVDESIVQEKSQAAAAKLWGRLERIVHQIDSLRK
jgi:putative selenium metabolism protein SsnA